MSTSVRKSCTLKTGFTFLLKKWKHCLVKGLQPQSIFPGIINGWWVHIWEGQYRLLRHNIWVDPHGMNSSNLIWKNLDHKPLLMKNRWHFLALVTKSSCLHWLNEFDDHFLSQQICIEHLLWTETVPGAVATKRPRKEQPLPSHSVEWSGRDAEQVTRA